jgi:pimeloyl-ACP methyl ester carboxylesterase
MNHFTEALGLSRYTLYMQDYGGPVGFRMALAHPERIEALIVQDAVAHNEGLGANWKPRRPFWADRATNESALRSNLLSLAFSAQPPPPPLSRNRNAAACFAATV